MPPPPLYDLKQFDFENPVVTLDEIREYNPQRHEMEQLSGIVHLEEDPVGVVGFKDLTHDEFWCRGHMPGYPIMPGVVQCEVAAQLASYYSKRFEILKGDILGFGGMNEIRFRSPVFPGDRFVVAAKLLKLRAGRQATFEFQGFVEDRMVVSGQTIGVPLKTE
ncbi:3-hydroxyacyl-ACP dehydratase FabZ family protein [Stratiformator vulcanicus]|uniref:3-hydroxyacyl-[acyl-carrier-protein] dehydratase FabZ n=1 Tax=Stratiformator vulcanicus TaxID=2527980 RepID=A0A517R5W5_9PLAN|nr:beta-hydroxyacyl-ACP dehydratase [Stratiformator vulcanicus]QDT39287.1 3-hydroxyacyl-[acyl-carrier-protein] dehydratase FabZ [Stratiformator vulcanicus]